MKSDPALTAQTDERLPLAACATAIATLIPVALFQTGVLRTLPDPPLDVFDSERITSSKTAHPMGIPDAVLGLASFSATFALMLLGRRHAAAKQLLGAKLTLDAAAATFNAGRQVILFGKLCSWCTATAIATGIMAYGGRDAMRATWHKVSNYDSTP